MFEKVVIVGVGLLGGSLARDLRNRGLANRIIGVCRTEATRDFALQNTVVDEVLPMDRALKNADLVVLATPMQVMLPLLVDHAHLIEADTILTDVGSVKTDLYAQLRTHSPELLTQFVLAHPIAGGESSGVKASVEGLFEDKHVIITTTQEVGNSSVALVEQMWRETGAKVVLMSLQKHDAIFAKTSHLPHVVAFSLVNYLSSQPNREELFDLAASGFYDFTRIASSDAVMWRDICITNKDQILAALDGFRAQLDDISNNIRDSDQQGILELFGAAKNARNAGLLNKGRNKSDE